MTEQSGTAANIDDCFHDVGEAIRFLLYLREKVVTHVNRKLYIALETRALRFR